LLTLGAIDEVVEEGEGLVTVEVELALDDEMVLNDQVVLDDEVVLDDKVALDVAFVREPDLVPNI